MLIVDASERFLRGLEGVKDPERKRKIIGNEFIAVFEEEAKKIGPVDFLVQGTLYPDVIESVPAENREDRLRPLRHITMWAACRIACS